jgi:hypothetical protein
MILMVFVSVFGLSMNPDPRLGKKTAMAKIATMTHKAIRSISYFIYVI